MGFEAAYREGLRLYGTRADETLAWTVFWQRLGPADPGRLVFQAVQAQAPELGAPIAVSALDSVRLFHGHLVARCRDGLFFFLGLTHPEAKALMLAVGRPWLYRVGDEVRRAARADSLGGRTHGR